MKKKSNQNDAFNFRSIPSRSIRISRFKNRLVNIREAKMQKIKMASDKYFETD